MTFSSGVLSFLATAGSWDLVSLLVRLTLIPAIGGCLCVVLRNASAATRHLTATATLTALIAFPVAWVLLPSVALPILPAATTSTPVALDSTPAVWTTGTSSAPIPETNAGSAAEVVRSTTPVASSWRILDLAILTALLVASALLFHVLISFFAAWVTARRARRIEDAELRRALRSACERLGVSRAVDLRESSSVTVPVVWGLFRPVLLLPVEARGWSREQLRIVFLHEVAHVARHDSVGLLFARIATSLFWFHPLVWKLARVARRECERSCDDLVLAAGERATDYAEHLLAIVRSMTRRDPFAGVAPALAQRSNLEGRLASILRSGQRRGPVSRFRLLATIGGAALLLVATAVVQVVAAPDRTDSESVAGDPATKVADDGSENSDDCPGTVQGVEDPSPLSPETASEGGHRFTAGEKAFQQGAYVRAATSYLAAGAIGYRRPESFYRAARALAKAGANDDALNAIGAAVEAGFDQAAVIGSDPFLESLRADPRFLAIITPKPPEVMSVPGVPPPVYSVAGSSHKKSDDLNQSGIEFMRAGQYERAITAFEEEIRASGSSNAMYNLACAHALRGDKRRAFDALETAIENGFDNTQHMTEDEDLRLLQGDPHFYQLARLTKDLQLFGSGRFGSGMKDEDDWRQALSRFERVTREHPEVGRAWANLGYARLEAGDPKGGATAYQRALDLGYQKSTMMYNVACCAARSGNVDEAFRWLDRADKAGFEVGEYAGSDSDLDALRSDPRYDALLDRWDEKMAKEHRDKERAEKTD